MFTKPILFVAFLVAASVESVKMGGSDIIHSADLSLARFAARSDLAETSVCFSEFSKNQGNTVRELGEDWQMCGDNEARANSIINQNLDEKAQTIGKIPNDFCVKIDDQCRDKFVRDGNVEEALECYIGLPISAQYQILDMAESCKLAILNAENESRSVLSTKQNCTNEANFKYSKNSNLLFEKVTSSCEISSSVEGSTSVATSAIPIRPTPPSTPEIEVSPTTQSVEIEQPTRRFRFPWN